MLTRDLLRRLPKTELHVHLDGSVRPQTLLDLAKDQGVKLPATNVRDLAHYMHVTDARNLVDYLARFDVTLSVLQTPEALERVAYELLEDGAKEHVRYM
jgi:adenosine deaminase